MERTEEYLKLFNDFESKLSSTLGAQGSVKGSTVMELKNIFKFFKNLLEFCLFSEKIGQKIRMIF